MSIPGPHHLHCGDCIEVLAAMPRESVDLIVTSPPYNLGINYSSYGDRRAEEDYLAWMTAVAEALRRVLRPGGSFFLNVAGSSTQPWLPFELIVRLRALFALQNHIAWIKSIAIGDDGVGHFKPVPGERFLHRNHEHVFHLTHQGRVQLDRLSIGVPFKDKSNIARRGHARDLRCRGDTWFIPYKTVQSRAEKFSHPGTFPLDLPRWCIRLHGQPGATVLDPFAGAGTTVLAAAMEGCTGIGIEVDADYVATAEARLAELSLQAATPDRGQAQDWRMGPGN